MPSGQVRCSRRRPTAEIVARIAVCFCLLIAALVPAAAREDVGTLYAEALQQLAAGDPATAVALLDRAIDLEPERSGPWDLRGWALLRLGEAAEAEASFLNALEREPDAAGPRAGIGYALLQQGRAGAALGEFEASLALDPANGDAARGRVRTLVRLARWDEAEAALAPLLAAAPEDAELLQQASRIANAPPAEERRPREAALEGPLRLVSRAGDTYLEVRDGSSWRPLFVKGVNLGVARPGRFPTEFPTDVAIYRGWLESIGRMNANAIRLYTLLPPAFYRALAQHNLEHPDLHLWLIQGAWVELPPAHDFEDPEYKSSFRREIERVLDALHGNLDLPARPGRASGRYRADISEHVLALVLGREWEPFSVVAHNELYPGEHSYDGRFAVLEAGSAMEAWLAWVVDSGIAYETDRYRAQRPVAFSNWPTLDPLDHPTESSRAEENAMRRARGEEVRERRVPQYNDDEVTVDSERIIPTPANEAGLFASYHVYPYHPDFMNLDPRLQATRDSAGPSPYLGYLRDLKRHHAGQPLLISELGLPTGRGVAHVNPLGWNHGGQSERRQGERDGRMMDGVLESGCAGGVLFAWMDEWFKRTWITGPFEIPASRDPLWHNLLDPEESFGILAARAGPEEGGHVLDGDASEWAGMEGALRQEFDEEMAGCAAPGRLAAAGADADAAWLHLFVEVDGAGCGGSFDWEELTVLIGIDTHGDDRGDRRLEPDDRRLLPSGVEFRVRLAGPGRSLVEVDPSYDIGSNEPDGPFVSLLNQDGRYVSMRRVTNRRRIGRGGTEFPSIQVDQSPLRYLSEDPSSPERADVAVAARGNSGVVEIRLPWALLNFTDPSSHRVLDQPGRHPAPFEASTTDRIRLHLSVRGSAGEEIDARSLEPFRWQGWDHPVAHYELKESYYILRDKFAALPDEPGERMR